MCNRRKVRVIVREKDYLDLLKKFDIELHPSHTKECVIEVPDNEDSYKYLSTKEGILDWNFTEYEKRGTNMPKDMCTRSCIDVLKDSYKEVPNSIDLLKLLKGIHSVRLISPGFNLSPHNLEKVMIPSAILSHIDIIEDKKYLEVLEKLENPYEDLLELLRSTWGVSNKCVSFSDFFNIAVESLYKYGNRRKN